MGELIWTDDSRFHAAKHNAIGLEPVYPRCWQEIAALDRPVQEAVYEKVHREWKESPGRLDKAQFRFRPRLETSSLGTRFAPELPTSQSPKAPEQQFES